jgi:hypothetical protein
MRNESIENGGQTSKEKVDNRHRKTQQRPNPKSLLGDEIDSGIGLRSKVCHGKCVGVDSRVDKR